MVSIDASPRLFPLGRRYYRRVCSANTNIHSTTLKMEIYLFCAASC